MAASSKAPPSPPRRFVGATAKFKTSASSFVCRPIRNPDSFPAASLAMPRMPCHSKTSRTLASGQNTASGDWRRISATAPASSARSRRSEALPWSRRSSVAMRRATFPEKLRVRAAHIVRIEAQRVRRSSFLQLLHADSPDDSSQCRGNSLDALAEPFAAFPSAFMGKQPSIRRGPGDFLSGRQLRRGLDIFSRGDHHLFADPYEIGALLSIDGSKHLSALGIDEGSHTLPRASSL